MNSDLPLDQSTIFLSGFAPKRLKLADALNIRGTPAFVIGDKVVPGVADIATLKSMVADARNK
jgi:hypothetical protein